MMTTSCIKYTVLVLTILSCMTKSRSQVTVFKEIINEDVFVNCHVCSLDHDITLYPPSYNPDAEDNIYFAVCHKPIHVHVGVHQCENPLHTINLDTKTVTFRLGRIGAFDNGNWTCTHGSLPGYITLEAPEKNPDQTCGGHSGEVCGLLVLLLFLVTVPFSCCLYPTFSTLFRRYFRRPSDREKNVHLLLKNNQDEGEGLRCKTCGVLSVCAICTNCELFYCVVCAEHHTKNKPSHGVCELNHTESNRITGKCKSCLKKPIKKVCIKCNKLLCEKCHCNHSEQEDNVRQLRTDLHRSGSTSECKILVDSTSLTYTVCYTETTNFPTDVSPVRVCGLAFLSQRRIVLADSKNKKIMVFKGKDCIVKYALDGEPRGITRIYDNKFAVSFASSQRIVLYEISGESIIKNKVYSMSTIGKPFSISYHQDHYAVEIGEGEDGFIVILDHEGKEIYKIPNYNNFAFYTGNTIRICLNMIDSCVYVAAMSKKIVSCVKFDGTILWNSQFPSPRGIVLIPGRNLANKNLLLASKRGSIIYQINTSDGTADILLNEKAISGPRYIAYEPTESLLCVQVDGFRIKVYNYDTGEI